MEMVPQQAVGECIRNRADMKRLQLQEIGVVPIFVEDILAVVAAIVDMIVLARFE